MHVQRSFFYGLGIIGLTLLPFQNCSVENGTSTATLLSSQSSFQHIDVGQNCAACHQNNFLPTHRPTDGRDCVFCHGVKDWKIGDFQLDGQGHQPKAASCVACHQIDAPQVARLPDSQPAQSGHYTGKDCVLCHEPPHDRFVFSHVDSKKNKIGFCLPCHQSVGMANHASNPEYFQGDGNCQQCHSTDRFALRAPATAPNPALAFTSVIYSGGVGAVTVDQVLSTALQTAVASINWLANSDGSPLPGNLPVAISSCAAQKSLDSAGTLVVTVSADTSNTDSGCPLNLQMTRTLGNASGDEPVNHFEFTLTVANPAVAATLGVSSYTCLGTSAVDSVHASCVAIIAQTGQVTLSYDYDAAVAGDGTPKLDTQYVAAVNGVTYAYHASQRTNAGTVTTTSTVNGQPFPVPLLLGTYLFPPSMLGP